MASLHENALLLTRGRESIRVVRVSYPDGRAALVVHGPGHAHAVHRFADVAASVAAQRHLENAWCGEGFRQYRLGPERRSGYERRNQYRGPERRFPG